MKKSLSLTLLVIAGLALFSIASCGGSSEREYYVEEYEPEAETTELAQADYSYDYEDNYYDTYETEESVSSGRRVLPTGRGRPTSWQRAVGPGEGCRRTGAASAPRKAWW